MSGPLLTAIIKLFAIVAKEDEVTKHERTQIESYLSDNLSHDMALAYLQEFDSYSSLILQYQDANIEEERKQILQICKQINNELTRQQKIVIIVELISIIIADGTISDRESELLGTIGEAFNISTSEISNIEQFILGASHADFLMDDLLIISSEPDNLGFNYKHMFREGLAGLVAILRIPGDVDSFFLKFIGRPGVMLNGIPLPPNTVKVLAPGSSIRRDKMSPIYFGDIVAKFLQEDTSQPTTFEAKNLHYKFASGKLGLKGINLSETGGRLVGIMGASGSGKSTLCNVLNGSEHPSKGFVKINGVDIHEDRAKVAGVMGHVPQDDLLIEDLTVYQNLYYAAKLCFEHMSPEELTKLVEKTLLNLGLMAVRDLKVGSPISKTISGGQRKRVNIGLELLREPSVLFLDEPTSGLSSRDAENIMDLLKELALKGKLIFVVIHQPSSDIFKSFDRLLILDTGGYQIYYGNPIEAVTYFKNLIQLVDQEQGECIECGNVNPEQIFNIIETKVVNEYGTFTNKRKISPKQWSAYFEDKIEIPLTEHSTDPPPVSLNLPNKLKQVGIFIRRDLLSKVSNRQYVIINLLEAPALAALLSFIIYYFDPSVTDQYVFGLNDNIPAYIFMSTIVALFMGLTVSAEEIVRDLKIRKREKFLNLSRGSYLFSKILIQFTISAVQTLLFVLVGSAILGIQDHLLMHWAILFSISCLANMLGLNVSSAFKNAITIYILIPILIIPQLLLSGVVVNFDRLNPSMTREDRVPLVGEVMGSRWAFEATMVGFFKENRYEKHFYEVDQQIANAEYQKNYYFPTLEKLLAYCQTNFRSMDPDISTKVDATFNILRTEIGAMLGEVGEDKLAAFPKLVRAHFTEEVASQTSEFLETMRRIHVNRFNDARALRTEIENQLQSNLDIPLDRYREQFQNKALASMVVRQDLVKRIIETPDGLVRKWAPIFMVPEADGPLDFRTQFYVPSKPFLGQQIDTVYFNIAVIWFMTLIWYFALYLNLPKKLVEFLEDLGRSSRS